MAGVATYQYFRFSPTKLRNGAAANSVQMSELRFYLDGAQLNGASATNPGGNNPGGEGPANLVDNSTGTKWLDFNKGAVILNYGSPVTINSYRWATANDVPDRDPIRWTLEGSDDTLAWNLLDDRSQSDQSVTTSRRALLGELDLNQRPDTPTIAYQVETAGGIISDSAVGIANGESATLTWEVVGANSVTLSGAPVSSSGSLVVSPAATTAYELVATNTFGAVPTTITVYAGIVHSPPTINEIAASQTRDGVLCDEDGDPSDWIEIHNPNPFTIDAGGYFLTDDPTGVTKWQIPSGTLMDPSGYLIIFASGKNRSGDPLHASFELSRNGEYLGFLDQDGLSVIEEFSPGYPTQNDNVSYGQSTDGFDYFTGPTPGAINDTQPGNLGANVLFGTAPQSFSGSLPITLSSTNPEAQIRFTTDGSLPTENSTLYTGPFSITDSALVRARTFETGFAPGKIKAEAYIEVSSTVANQTSDLPIIVIDNFGGGSIPNNVDLQSAYLTLFEPDPVSGRTSISDLPTKANRAGIKRRGSSTLNDPKGNYRIEFWQDGSEEDRNINLLGMSDHNEWILFAPYRFDRSLLRIPFIHSLSNDIQNYAPKSRFVELYINTGGNVSTSDYQGVYVLQERISRDKDRVDVDRLDKNDIAGDQVTGGYILSIDRLDGADRGFRSSLGHPFDPPNGSPQPWFTYVYPKEQNLLPQQETYIKGYIDDFESALYGPNYTDPDTGYQAFLDVKPSIDFHILTTFSKDPDGLRLSTYLFKPRNGKLAFGPIWDFDRTMGADDDNRAASPTGWNPSPERAEFFDYDYWGRLFDDPNFMQAWIDRWQELRRGEFSTSALSSRIDGLAAQVSESQPRNQARWPEVSPNGGALTSLSGWNGEVDHLKNWLTIRADWIDTQFVKPPLLQESGSISSGTMVSAAPQEGALYYTIDGSDPRLPGGAISPSALSTTNGILLNQTRTITARARLSGDWSGPLQSTFIIGVPADATNLVVSEIMYHPAPVTIDEQSQGVLDESDFEFIELQNISQDNVVLTGSVFSGVFDLVIPETVIPPGQTVVFARNAAAFHLRYGSSIPIAGVFGDPGLPDGGQKISNGGETLTLTGFTGSIIQSFRYDDDPATGWPTSPDGLGTSLVLRSPLGLPDHSQPTSWRASLTNGGSPGAATNGLYEEWTSLYFNSNDLNRPEISGPHADPDGDGLENLFELAFGSNPSLASDHSHPVAAVATLSNGVPQIGDYLTLTFNRQQGLDELSLNVMLADDLLNWSETALLYATSNNGDGTDTVTYRSPLPISENTPKKFARVELALD